MMLFKLQKNNNPEMKEAYGNYYALPVILQTMGIAELAVMMAEHNTGFSAGATQGLLTDMVKCIRELVLQGIAVKIDNLAIFSLGIKPKKGADSEDDFSVAKNVEGVRLRARATGNFTRESLDINASLKNYDSFVKGAGDDSPTTPSGGGGSTSQGSGSTTTGGGSGSSGGGSTPSGGGSTPSGGGSSEGDGNVKEY